MNRRKMLVALVVVTAALTAGHSQISRAADDASRQSFEIQIAEMREQLALTPEQEQKLTPILKERNEKLREVLARRDANASVRDKRAIMKDVRAIQEDFNARIAPILSQEQMKTWEAYRKEMQQKARDRYRNRTTNP